MEDNMGKIWDYMRAKDWEEFQRIQLYKNIGKYLKNQTTTPEKMKRIQEIMEE